VVRRSTAAGMTRGCRSPAGAVCTPAPRPRVLAQRPVRSAATLCAASRYTRRRTGQSERHDRGSQERSRSLSGTRLRLAKHVAHASHVCRSRGRRPPPASDGGSRRRRRHRCHPRARLSRRPPGAGPGSDQSRWRRSGGGARTRRGQVDRALAPPHLVRSELHRHVATRIRSPPADRNGAAGRGPGRAVPGMRPA